MIIQDEDYNPSIYMDRLPILAVAETINELERKQARTGHNFVDYRIITNMQKMEMMGAKRS